MLAREILQLAENGVAEFLVEPSGLKAKRIEVDVPTVSADRFALSSSEQSCAVASTSKLLGNPQEINR